MNHSDILVARCRKFVADNDFSAAAELISELSATDGCQAQASYLNGAVQFKQGDYSAAGESLDKSLAIDPALSDALELRLRLATLQNENALAADLAVALIAQSPKSVGVLNMSAKALAKAGRIDEAAEAWERIADLTPVDPAPLLAVANAYFKAKSYSRTFDAAVAAFERDAQAVQATLLAAESAAKSKDLAKLAWAAPRLSALDADAARKYVRTLNVPEYLTVAAQLLVNLGADALPEEVEPVVSRLVKTMPTEGDENELAERWALTLKLDPTNKKASSFMRRHISALMKSGNEMLDSGDNARAIDAFRRLVALDDQKGTVWRKLAIALNREQFYRDEAQAWRKLALLTDDADAWQRALRAIRKCDPSEEQLQLFIDVRTHVGDEPGLTEKGDSLARKLTKLALDQTSADQVGPGLSLLRTLSAWSPDSPVVDKLRQRLRTALTQAVRGDSDAAERTEAAEKLLTIDPSNLYALQWLSRTYFKTRRFEAASVAYEKLIAIDPKDESYWLQLSRCRKAMKRQEPSGDLAGSVVAEAVSDEYMQKAEAN
jgi:tetratricopeptide (TPR) repeat protein